MTYHKKSSFKWALTAAKCTPTLTGAEGVAPAFTHSQGKEIRGRPSRRSEQARQGSVACCVLGHRLLLVLGALKRPRGSKELPGGHGTGTQRPRGWSLGPSGVRLTTRPAGSGLRFPPAQSPSGLSESQFHTVSQGPEQVAGKSGVTMRLAPQVLSVRYIRVSCKSCDMFC